MPQFPFHFFKEYVVRSPIFSYQNFREKFSHKEISILELKEICCDPVFQEAIYLASPNLYHELNQYLQSEKKTAPNQYQKLKNTILKYYIRMSNRCTPFGLFSGVGIGAFLSSYDDPSDRLKKQSKIRDTKLDMHLLVSLAKCLENIKHIRANLLYFPNSSIYRVGKKIRFIEYENNKGKRDYFLSSAPLSEELQKAINFSLQGKTIYQISKILVDNDISYEDANDFIEELIDNQVLVSELEPNVSGIDFLETIIYVLQKMNAKKEADVLVSIKQKLNQLDLHIGNPTFLYEEIKSLIKFFITDYDEKYLFQTDLYFQNNSNLSSHWKKEIKKGIAFLNKITAHSKETDIERFKRTFYERFENQEMPLSYVLDTEIGIGYKQNIATKGIHTYLDDLKISNSKTKPNLSIQLTPFQKILNEKLQEAALERRFTIELKEEDLKDYVENWDDLPDTLSLMAEIVSENTVEKLYIGNIGGNSAANLLGRFCSDKSPLQNITKKITKREAEVNAECIVAEIIHLPEARIGNIIRRPTLRQFEIPYLAKSILPNENQISVDDLYISMKNERLVLRSKTLNKEVKPFLTNAHNYYTNTLPIYNFLSDLQSQNKRTGLYFDWGGLKQIYKFLPRIEYNNIIISKAQWHITEKDLANVTAIADDNKDEFLSALKKWRIKRQIPQWVQLVQSDNTLTINLENFDIAKLLIQILKNNDKVIIEEFLFNKNDNLKKEYVFSLFKKQNQ